MPRINIVLLFMLSNIKLRRVNTHLIMYLCECYSFVVTSKNVSQLNSSWKYLSIELLLLVSTQKRMQVLELYSVVNKTFIRHVGIKHYLVSYVGCKLILESCKKKNLNVKLALKA